MKKERVRSKHGFKGFGIFILGWFIGFICTILILAGLGYWAYTSISVRKIEKWTKTDITSNKGVEDLTIKKVVGIVQGINNSGSGAYTIAKLEEDFNITLIDEDNAPFGIDMSIIKNSPIGEFKKAIDDTIDTVTFNNVMSFMEVEGDLGLLNTVLDTEIKYYIKNGKLYTSSDYSTEVDFTNYTITETEVEFSNGTHTIKIECEHNVITPMLRHIPLNSAMENMESATQDLKIYEVLGYTQEETAVAGEYIYKDNGVEVTGIMASLAGYSVGELSDSETFDGLYVYEVMGYYENAGKFYKTYSGGEYLDEAEGVLKHLMPSTLGDLTTTINGLSLGQALDIEYASAKGVVKTFYNTPITDLASKIENIKIYEAMGYYYNEADEKYYTTFDGTNYTNEVVLTGIMKAIIDTKVDNLGTTIENLKAVDIFDRATTPVLNLFVVDNGDGTENTTELDNLTVMNMPNAVVDKINSDTTTIGTLIDAGVIEVEGTVSDTVRGMTIEQLITIMSQTS